MNRKREREIERDERIRARGLTLRERLEWDRDLLESLKLRPHFQDTWEIWERALYRWRKATDREPDPVKRAWMQTVGDASEGRVATMVEMTWESLKLKGKVPPDDDDEG